MKRLYSNELKEHIGEEVLIQGFLFQKRIMGNINFLLIRDKFGIVQCVVKDKDQIEILKDVMDESVLEITGNCVEEKRSSIGVEIHNPKVNIISKVKYPLNIEINKPIINANIDTILDNRAISLRSPLIRSVFNIQAQMAKAFREFADKNGSKEIFIPTIVGSATEGGSELFEIKYYDKKAYLGQSGQLYKQMMVGVFERVYAISHSYRAEKFGTSRHTSEFIQYEFEMGFIKDYMDVINFGIDIIRYIKDSVEKENIEDLKIINKELPLIPKNIPIMKLKEAQDLIFEKENIDHRGEKDLSPEDEKLISKIIKDLYKSDLVVITHYPTSKRPFYTMPDPQNPEETLSFDFILRGLEILTGSQRIHEYEQLILAIEKKGLDPKNYEDYLEIFKYGMPHEGGFGMGFERLTQQFLSLSNIREATLFPRDVKRITP